MIDQNHLSGEMLLTATSDCRILPMQCYHYLKQNRYNFIVLKMFFTCMHEEDLPTIDLSLSEVSDRHSRSRWQCHVTLLWVADSEGQITGPSIHINSSCKHKTCAGVSQDTERLLCARKGNTCHPLTKETAWHIAVNNSETNIFKTLTHNCTKGIYKENVGEEKWAIRRRKGWKYRKMSKKKHTINQIWRKWKKVQKDKIWERGGKRYSTRREAEKDETWGTGEEEMERGWEKMKGLKQNRKRAEMDKQKRKQIKK